jgi:hypothetical protein
MLCTPKISELLRHGPGVPTFHAPKVGTDRLHHINPLASGARAGGSLRCFLPLPGAGSRPATAPVFRCQSFRRHDGLNLEKSGFKSTRGFVGLVCFVGTRQ